MALIYGTGFKPVAPAAGENRERSTGNTALFIFERVLSVVAFIALSFIPVAGEAAEAGIVAGEAASEATAAAVEATEAVATGFDVTETTAVSASTNILRLGQTVRGATALGLAEATVNTGIDFQEGTESIVNEALNFGLAFIPLAGVVRGRRLANVRLLVRADKEIARQEEIIRIAETVEQREAAELRIRQLKNIKLTKSAKIFDSTIVSADRQAARQAVLDVVDEAAKNETNITVKSISKTVRQEILKDNIKLSKMEVRRLVRFTTKNIPHVTEGLTLHAVAKSKSFNRVVNTLRLLDPNLAVRKGWTKLARFLTHDEAFLEINGKTIIGGKKINIGIYKKYAKKLSAFWRKQGAKIYKASKQKMIPAVSKWIEGVRLIETGVPDEYVMIVMFKPSKNGRVPQPRIISPVTLYQVFSFLDGDGYGQSPGSYYINVFALARNGSGPNIIGGLASVLGPIPLGELRTILGAPAAFERVIRDFAKGDYLDQWRDSIVETSSRLWAHKVGKVLAGRWGIATARGFQRTSKGHTSLQTNFDWRYLIDEVGVVALDKARSVQRKAGIQGRTATINGKRILNQYKRSVKLMTFGYVKFDGKTGFKKGNGIF